MYLLNLAHPVGGSQSKFFEGSVLIIQMLKNLNKNCLELGKNEDVKDQKSSEDSSGTNYMIIG